LLLGLLCDRLQRLLHLGMLFHGRLMPRLIGMNFGGIYKGVQVCVGLHIGVGPGRGRGGSFTH
jgi:hypothetical protein